MIKAILSLHNWPEEAFEKDRDFVVDEILEERQKNGFIAMYPFMVVHRAKLGKLQRTVFSDTKSVTYPQF